jgi:muconolactone delta-isomerase
LPTRSRRAKRSLLRNCDAAANGAISGRLVGEYTNYCIFDVESNTELHKILTGLPLFPYMTITATSVAATRRQCVTATPEGSPD